MEFCSVQIMNFVTFLSFIAVQLESHWWQKNDSKNLKNNHLSSLFNGNSVTQ